MTKKDYVLIAAAMRKAIALSDTLPADVAKPFHDGMTAMARLVAGALQTENSRFDFERFIKAADVDTFESRSARTVPGYTSAAAKILQAAMRKVAERNPDAPTFTEQKS